MTPGQPSPYTPQTPGANLDVLGQSVSIKLSFFVFHHEHMPYILMLLNLFRIGIRLI